MPSNSLHSPLSSGEECFQEGGNDPDSEYGRGAGGDETSRHKHRKHKHKSRKHRKHRSTRPDDEYDDSTRNRQPQLNRYHQSQHPPFPNEREMERNSGYDQSLRNAEQRTEEYEQVSDGEDFPSDNEIFNKVGCPFYLEKDKFKI